MSVVHIYTAPLQPATCFEDRIGTDTFTFRLAPRSRIYTDCCRVRRWAKYVQVQVYADYFYRWCAPGYGCKKKLRKGKP